MAIQTILPDPYNKILPSGNADNVNGAAGPGFSSVKLSSKQNIMRARSNSGRVISRANSYHQWDVSISYNPMTKQEFLPVSTFLLEKQVSLVPFYVSLPQYVGQGVTVNPTVSGAHNAGASTVLLNTGAEVSIGSIFNIVDSQNTDHTKTYMVTSVNGSTLTIVPALAKDVTTGSTANFMTPVIRVIQSGDTVEYSLNTENLYSFSLQLEEASS